MLVWCWYANVVVAVRVVLGAGSGANTSLDVYLGVYAALGFGYAFLTFFAAITLAFGGIAAANKLHT